MNKVSLEGEYARLCGVCKGIVRIGDPFILMYCAYLDKYKKNETYQQNRNNPKAFVCYSCVKKGFEIPLYEKNEVNKNENKN